MKLLVISDSHGCTNALRDVLAAEPEAENVIFLGDGIRDVEALEDEYPNRRFYSVRGNCDYASFAGAEGIAPFGGVVFLYTHGHLYDVKETRERLAAHTRASGAQVALYGHTHRPLLEEMAGVLCFNPGAVSCSRTGYGAHYGVVCIENGVPSFLHKEL